MFGSEFNYLANFFFRIPLQAVFFPHIIAYLPGQNCPGGAAFAIVLRWQLFVCPSLFSEVSELPQNRCRLAWQFLQVAESLWRLFFFATFLILTRRHTEDDKKKNITDKKVGEWGTDVVLPRGNPARKRPTRQKTERERERERGELCCRLQQ